jgi:hypothetical protein
MTAAARAGKNRAAPLSLNAQGGLVPFELERLRDQ